jgi:hypothetical protein
MGEEDCEARYMKFPKLGGLVNRTQPIRMPAENLTKVKTYQLTKMSELTPEHKREYYATEPAPRAPGSWLPGKTYFGWTPREEKIEGTEKKYLVFEHPERQSKILFAGPTIYPIQKRSVRQTTEEGREKYGRMSGSAKDTVREREYNPADFIPVLNAIEKDKKITVNLTGANIKREVVLGKYGKSQYKYSDQLIDQPAEEFGEWGNVRSKVKRELVDKEGKPIMDYYGEKPLTVTEKVTTGRALKFTKDDQSKHYQTPNSVIVNMRSALGENVNKDEIKWNARGAVAHAAYLLNEDKSLENRQKESDKTKFDNWGFTENTSEYAGDVEPEVEELGKMAAEREEAKYATYKAEGNFRDNAKFKPMGAIGFREVSHEEYYMKHEEEPQELAQEERKGLEGTDSEFTYRSLTHKPKRKAEADSSEYAGDESEVDAELESLFENKENK